MCSSTDSSSRTIPWPFPLATTLPSFHRNPLTSAVERASRRAVAFWLGSVWVCRLSPIQGRFSGGDRWRENSDGFMDWGCWVWFGLFWDSPIFLAYRCLVRNFLSCFFGILFSSPSGWSIAYFGIWSIDWVFFVRLTAPSIDLSVWLSIDWLAYCWKFFAANSHFFFWDETVFIGHIFITDISYDVSVFSR